MKKELFTVTGMDCASCSARVESKVSKISGVESAAVNLIAGTMSVTYDEVKTNSNAIIKKVEAAGYGAALAEVTSASGNQSRNSQAENVKKTNSSNPLKTRLIVSWIFTIPIFYISMADMIGLPLPSFMTGAENALIFVFTMFLLTVPVVAINWKYFHNGFKNLFKLSPNMDSLIALGSGAALIYGIYAIYKIGWGLGHGNFEMVHDSMMNVYLESAATILALITLGKFLEERARGKTNAAITKLIGLAPKTALVVRDDIEQEIPVEQIIIGDILIIKAGSSIAVDGVIIEGTGSLDESVITGESLPVDKNPGDKVVSGTVNQSGWFKMSATAIGTDTTLSKIIKLMEDASATKAPIARLADKISGIFVPVVLSIALVATVIWLALGYNIEFALTVGISVLIISCPCALGIATPTAIMVGTGKGALNGILIKSAEALENLHSIDVVVLDKTGTITLGRPQVVELIPNGLDKEEFIKLAASLEKMSSHPLAMSIAALTDKYYKVSNFEMLPGKGIAGTIGKRYISGGNRKLMESCGVDITQLADYQAGGTALYFADGSTYLGAIILADTIKKTSVEAVAEFKRMGLEVIMLTGDNAAAAEAIRKQAGIDKVIAEVLPEDKENVIKNLRQSGKKVAMVGDGINDAPALASADVGIAIGSGTDIAIEAADVVLVKNDLKDVASAIQLSKATMRNVKQNLFWAFFYNSISIPVAAGLLYPITGWLLNPMIAAAAMSFSDVTVILNALRLKLWKKPS